MAFDLEEHAEKCQARAINKRDEWVRGEFLPRDPYVQLFITVDAAMLLAVEAQRQGKTVAALCRSILYARLKESDF